MPDFTHDAWSWFIGAVSVASIVILIIFAVKMSGRRKPGEAAQTMGHVWDEDLAELNNPLPRWWLNLFYITLFWGLAYLFLYPGLGAFGGWLGWTQIKQYEEEIAAAEASYGPIFEQYLQEDIPDLAAVPEAVAIGGRLFATYCTTCHGSDARGARGFPNLTDAEWLYGGAPENIETSILAGRQGVMPPFEPQLGYEGVFNVSEYVRTLSGRSADPLVSSRGRAVYEQNCVVCHGADGRGNPQLGAPDLTNDIWLYGGSQKRIFESIAKGRSGNMPPHRGFLGEAKVHLLATYVYSLSTAD